MGEKKERENIDLKQLYCKQEGFFINHMPATLVCIK